MGDQKVDCLHLHVEHNDSWNWTSPTAHSGGSHGGGGLLKRCLDCGAKQEARLCEVDLIWEPRPIPIGRQWDA